MSLKMKKYNIGNGVGILLLVLWLTPLKGVVAADLLAPQVVLKEASVRFKASLEDETVSKDFLSVYNNVTVIIEPCIDFERISRLVLGKLWKKATPEQRVIFKQEFKVKLLRTYTRAFLEFKEWSIRYLPLRMAKEAKKTVVKTEVLQPGVQPIAVNYRMYLKQGTWLVYDIIIEGVSLVTNYRSSFKGQVKRVGSLDAMIDKLRKNNLAVLAP
jgi:phospholipid transport system substrate-binding protein